MRRTICGGGAIDGVGADNEGVGSVCQKSQAFCVRESAELTCSYWDAGCPSHRRPPVRHPVIRRSCDERSHTGTDGVGLFVADAADVVLRLQVDPELRIHVEEKAEGEGGLGAD